ncbi:hypothetical protein DFH09DRAFT_1189404 [Mycena vulgaris]|nr:hypothetical protein DFH09DRAFT_1189404 [Mycena vulgaris]
MTSPFRCAVPFYGDPGQPDGPVAGQKIYLVSGRNVRFPGAYVSWPSAHTQFNNVSNATVKGYKTWGPLESAWFASCDRGEHKHLSKTEAPTLPVEEVTRRHPQPGSPPRSCLPSPVLPSPVSKPSASSRPSSATKPPISVKRPLIASSLSARPRGAFPSTFPRSASGDNAAAAIPGKMAYAVRHNGQGVVFGDYASARELYHGLQARGEVPCLASTPSLTDGVCFVEHFSTESGSPEALQRQGWVEEERRARDLHIGDVWGSAIETWRLGRSGAWISESDSDDDESSVSTGTC